MPGGFFLVDLDSFRQGVLRARPRFADPCADDKCAASCLSLCDAPLLFSERALRAMFP